MDSCNHIYRLFRDLYRYSGQTGPRHAGGQYRHSTLIPFLPSPRFPKTPIFSLLLRALRLQAHMASTAADLADIPSLDLMTEILRRMKCAQKPDRRLILVGVCSHSPSLSFLNGSAGCVGMFCLWCWADACVPGFDWKLDSFLRLMSELRFFFFFFCFRICSFAFF